MSSNNTTQRRKFGRSNTAAGRTRRVMARNNMRRAVDRVTRDLHAIIDAAPESDETLRTLVAAEMLATMLAITGLWGTAEVSRVIDSDEDAGGR